MLDNLRKVFETEIGYLEKKSNAQLDSKAANAGDGNFTKYWRDIYVSLQGSAWCLCFLIWCFAKMFGVDLAKQLLYCDKQGWTFYTPELARRFQAAGRLKVGSPQPGDVVLFGDKKHKDAGRFLGIYHVGYIYEVSGNYIYTVEGNTNGSLTPLDKWSKTESVVPNGGGVFFKKYDITNKDIYFYYAAPDYSIIEQRPKYIPGWNSDENGWWYADTDHSYLAATWADINHARYYFDAKGYAVTGMQDIGGKRYVFENTHGAPKECALMETAEDGSLRIKHV